MVLLIIIPIKWLFHWEYTLFSDKPIFQRWIHGFSQSSDQKPRIDPWNRPMSGCILTAKWASIVNAIIISSSVGYGFSILTLVINALMEGKPPEAGPGGEKKHDVLDSSHENETCHYYKTEKESHKKPGASGSAFWNTSMWINYVVVSFHMGLVILDQTILRCGVGVGYELPQILHMYRIRGWNTGLINHIVH